MVKLALMEDVFVPIPNFLIIQPGVSLPTQPQALTPLAATYPQLMTNF